ncbi:MAG: PorV/PorQ family protein [Bacteroidales bacterium]|nr:PorV/PorQ family protein [Bacteroidales bacterium]
MNKLQKTLIICTLIGLFSALSINLYAGNRDRSGQAGAQHLLIDPWARSTGWGTAGVAEIRGLEAMYSNIGGMAFVNKTELAFSHTRYLVGSGAGIGISSFAIAQHLRSTNKETHVTRDFGVLGVSFYTMGFGDVAITSEAQPEGNQGTFSPKLSYLAIHYAKSFNDFIHGGVSIKVVTETGAADAKATGVALDAGVQYLTGRFKNFKIGLTLKNIGLPMKYKGDGLGVRAVANDLNWEQTLESRSASYELPTMLVLGLSYDFLIWGKEYRDYTKEDFEDAMLTRDDAAHRITLAGSFTANAFSRDIFTLGIEYALGQIFMVRAGYNFETGMFNPDNCTTWYVGPALGATVGIPLQKKEKGNAKIYLDYSYRFTNKWGGNHCVGLKLAL